MATDGSRGVQNFNCTIQELKGGWERSRKPAAAHFNCTIQELKVLKDRLLSDVELYFNCTIQELKDKHNSVMSYTEKISIAPYRN